MSESVHYQQAIAALSRFFVADASMRDTLQSVTELACDALPPADAAGLTMLSEGKPTTAVFTHEVAPRIDEVQYRTGAGPCLHASRHGEVVRVESTSLDDRWPAFASAARECGIFSTLSLPLLLNGTGIGALNLYARSERAFSPAHEASGAAFAEQAAIVVVNAQAYWDTYDTTQGLREAMASRATIEQAKGIIMARSGHCADEAFQVLVRVSQRENRKLRDVAAELVDRVTTARRQDSAAGGR